MRKGNANRAALQALYSAAHQVHRQIQKRQLQIARLEAEISDLRVNALEPMERLCERRAEQVERENASEWVSEPIYATR